MLDKMFNYFVGIALGYPMISILLFYVFQKLLSARKYKRTERIDAIATKVSSKFNFLLKNRIITRSDILTICDMLNKYIDNNKKFNNDCHKIYWVLKYKAVRIQDLANIELILDTANKKYKRNKKKQN